MILIAATEPHHAAPAEAPLEMLPPISGGSPDATSPEAEIEVPPATPSSSNETGSTAVLTEGGKARRATAHRRCVVRIGSRGRRREFRATTTIRSWRRPKVRATGAACRRRPPADRGAGRA